MAQDHPIVLISYSHDSPAHAERVLALANRLRRDGIDCRLDQYETSALEGWPQWMERQIADADFVLVVCTATYLRREKGVETPGIGQGARWEAALILQLIYDADSLNKHVLPVLFAHEDREHIPSPLKRATYYVLDSDAGYDRLYRKIIAFLC